MEYEDLVMCYYIIIIIINDNIMLRGPTPFEDSRLKFPVNFGHNYHFLFFLGEKVSSGIWETCPKILGGYVYHNPPQMGANILWKNLIPNPLFYTISDLKFNFKILIIYSSKVQIEGKIYK